jgi:hypothetical protein
VFRGVIHHGHGVCIDDEKPRSVRDQRGKHISEIVVHPAAADGERSRAMTRTRIAWRACAGSARPATLYASRASAHIIAIRASADVVSFKLSAGSPPSV